ncbi:MAG: hypothetical protein GY854_19505 [Deltaproteobacteria bacterium]|nr:hypothetical protein [Deltaproteobacteria bacterium]
MRGKHNYLFIVVCSCIAFAAMTQIARADGTLARSVRRARVIVVGEITRVARATGDSTYNHDVGFIRVSKVLKGARNLRSILGQTEKVPFCFPSVHNRLRVSTDVRYKKGEKGIWLLELRHGRFTGTKPVALIPLSRQEEVKREIEEKLPLRKHPPELRIVPRIPLPPVRGAL